MNIILSWDTSVANAPVGFTAALESVAHLYDALFTNTETIAVAAGFGEIGGTPLPTSDAGQSIQYLMDNNGTVVAVPEAMALGGGVALPIDGDIGFSASGIFDLTNAATIAAGSFDLVATAEHELSEVLGRISGLAAGVGASALDNVRYAAPGVLATAASPIAYFSLDNGVTDLGNFNTTPGLDPGDWATGGSLSNDAFAAAINPGVTPPISSADLLLMQALGYTENPWIAQAIATGNPILANRIAGVASNLLGLGGTDLFLLNTSDEIGVAEFAATPATIWFKWQSDGLAPASDNAVITGVAAEIAAAGTNALGFGGMDLTVSSAGAQATYEFTSSGAVYVSGSVMFSGSGDVVRAMPGTSVNLDGGAGNIVVMSSGSVVASGASAGTNIIGTGDTITMSGATDIGFIGGGSDTALGDTQGGLVNAGSDEALVIGGSGGRIGICGQNIAVSASDETIQTIPDASFNLSGDSDMVTLGPDTYLGVLGGNNQTIMNDNAGCLVNLTSNASATITGSGGDIGICGTAVDLTASGESIATVPDASFYLSGGNNMIGLGLGGSVAIRGGAGYNTIAVYNGTITALAPADINAAGGSSAINLDTAGATLGLLGGSGWTVSANGDTIQTLAGVSLTLNDPGASDQIILGPGSRLGLANGMGFISGASDVFSIQATATNQQITGFDAARGDRIDLSQILPGSAANWRDAISASTGAIGLNLTVAGANGSDTVTLVGLQGVTLTDLLSQNAFIAPSAQ